MALDNLLRSLYSLPARESLALLMLAGTLFFALRLFPAASVKSGSPANKVVDLQRAYTVEMFGRVLDRWSSTKDDAVSVMKSENIRKLDFIFPLLYGSTLAFGYAAMSGRRQPSALDLVLFVTPLVAALFDYVENTLHLRLLTGIETREDVVRAIEERRFSAALVFLASAFAYTKYMLLAVSASAIAVAALSRIRSAFAAHSPV